MTFLFVQFNPFPYHFVKSWILKWIETSWTGKRSDGVRLIHSVISYFVHVLELDYALCMFHEFSEMWYLFNRELFCLVCNLRFIYFTLGYYISRCYT